MIDLIANGLALRQKLSEASPQVFRSVSAGMRSNPDMDPAISADSAKTGNQSLYYGHSDKFKINPTAEFAGIADHQAEIEHLPADQLRKSCGAIVEPIIIKTICECGYRPPFCSCGIYKFSGKF